MTTDDTKVIVPAIAWKQNFQKTKKIYKDRIKIIWNRLSICQLNWLIQKKIYLAKWKTYLKCLEKNLARFDPSILVHMTLQYLLKLKETSSK